MTPKIKIIPAVIIFCISIGAFAEVLPEFMLSARGIMSLNLNEFETGRNSAVSDFSDSSLLIGFRQKLYNDFRAKFVIGFQFPDADSDLGQIFFHNVFIQVESKNSVFKIGRSRIRSSLIEFTTLRDDDALRFTDVMNPFSSGENTEESQFGNVIEISHVFRQKFWIRLHGEHFTKKPSTPEEYENDFGLNAIGVSFEYMVPDSLRWNRKVLKEIGISFNNFLTGSDGYSEPSNRMLKNIIFSTILNIRPDPVHFWDLRFQSIHNFGFSEIKNINNYYDMARALSFSAFTSIRYLYRKLERPSLQVTTALGYKVFPDLNYDTRHMTFISNLFYRIGSNFDIGLQFTHRRFYGDIEKLFGKKGNSLQLTVIFNIDASWNNHFDDRDSLLNLEHGYIK